MLGFRGVEVAWEWWEWINETKERIFRSWAKHIPQWLTPNFLSWWRIILASAILLMLFDYSWYRWIIGFYFGVAIIVDLLDGPLARIRKKETEEGAFLDRFGDKLLVCPMVVKLLWKYHPVLGATVVIGEIFSIALAVSAMARRVPTESNWLAKWKMAAQSIGVIIMLFLPQRPTWAFAAFVASLPLGAGSIWDYFKGYINSRSKTA